MSNVVGYAQASAPANRTPQAQEAELRAVGAVRVFVDHGESSDIASSRSERHALTTCARATRS